MLTWLFVCLIKMDDFNDITSSICLNCGYMPGAWLPSLRCPECGEIMFADTEAQKEALWFLRRRVGEAVKATSIYKEEDTVVPRYQLPKLLK